MPLDHPSARKEAVLRIKISGSISGEAYESWFIAGDHKSDSVTLAIRPAIQSKGVSLQRTGSPCSTLSCWTARVVVRKSRFSRSAIELAVRL